MKRSGRLVAGLGVVLVWLIASGVAYLRFGRTVAVPLAQALHGEVMQRVVGPGTVQAHVPVTLSSRITATLRQLDADVGDVVKRGQTLAVLVAISARGAAS